MKYADIIVPRGRPELLTEQNRIAVDFIVHNLEHHLVKAGYEIVVPHHKLIELVEQHELQAVLPMLKTLAVPQTDLKVLGPENDSEWRTVLASLYEHGFPMSKILTKHMCEQLWQTVVSSQVVGNGSELVADIWDFP